MSYSTVDDLERHLKCRDAEIERLRADLQLATKEALEAIEIARELRLELGARHTDVARLREALKFYANRDLYVWVDVHLARVLAVRSEEPWAKAHAALEGK